MKIEQIDEAIDIVIDLKISLENHSKGLDIIEQKRTADRIRAVNTLIEIAEHVKQHGLGMTEEEMDVLTIIPKRVLRDYKYAEIWRIEISSEVDDGVHHGIFTTFYAPDIPIGVAVENHLKCATNSRMKRKNLL